ncbi:fibrinogen-like YCDxxxxGGGW domain-containing protein [Microbacterium betulae]|uniref:Fibrinogen-like YCDxxxxGGGW domain-containing protein n=1 Tax=Microbacterium betulae TaxID=2981139 RepID=A0AA97I5B5_9MICO|nr:fibrinogen-like YCDxxxxGGGW domain-containing protein [Microbacterium sp. AB]WOF22634.1 fibrinogen-like YCDxxxxGGGW domain-containing protein [Microbacterium sp. AB]
MLSDTAPRRLRPRAAALTSLAVLVALLIPAGPAAAEDPALPSPDGLTEATAAASCWEIAQLAPDAPSGVYWIATPAMGAAERFFCDQETDGGGWVLVGRGREGWSESILGAGTPAQVRDTVTGTAAFAPRQLSGELIDQLNDDRPIGELADGIRLVRATNAAGTAWQDTTFQLSSPRDEWTWQFDNEQRVASYRIDGVQRTGGTTSSFGSGNGLSRVRTVTGSTEGWAMGFGYGSEIRGSTAATSFLWSKNTTTGYARPFTQVFLRPKLMSADVFSAIPDEGTPATTGPAVAQAFAEQQTWGVAGLGAGPSTLEGSNEVSAFAESGGRVLVGGNFTTVQRSAGGTGAETQSYLAAFDRDTGTWDPAFRPVFDNQVKALAALPDGRIAVGGYFSTVNGESHPGLVVLDATTGEVDASFTGALLNFLSGGVPVVRSLDVQDDWLYVGGSFTHAAGGGTQVYARAATRLSITTGVPDAWNPEFNGTVMSIDASAQGDRAYAAGYFSQSRGRAADKAAALSTSDETLVPWAVLFSNRSDNRQGYQQAVLEVGDRVWLGGSEHSLVSYRRDTMSVASSNITLAGGDFQAIASDGEAVYAGCHCFGSNYEGATAWPTVGTGWTGVDAVYGSGAWSATTGEYLPSFNGVFNTRAGAGAWALFVDSRGTLWQGGDFSYSTRAGFARQWSGGFVRHAASDTTSPSTPGGLTATAGADDVTLTWSASTDDRGVTAYEVLRADRVVASVTGTTLTLPAAPEGTRYAVRAVDAADNRSASTPATTAAEPEPAAPTLIDAGSTWSYLWTTQATPAGWNAPAFDDAAWATGAAPLGWGTGDIATTLDTSLSPRPVTSYHRHDVELTDPLPAALRLTVRADDGVVVYVNGTEVLRQNLDAGPVTPTTFANTAVPAARAIAEPVVADVPASAFVAGTNTIAVEVHSNYRTAASHSFEMTVTLP